MYFVSLMLLTTIDACPLFNQLTKVLVGNRLLDTERKSNKGLHRQTTIKSLCPSLPVPFSF